MKHNNYHLPHSGLVAFALILVSTTVNPLFGQKSKSFTGMIEYSISAIDTNQRDLYPDNKMLIYTNDTIVRMENFTSNFGKQVTIRHIEKNKSYQLLETAFGKFAIQTNLAEADTAQKPTRYTYEKTCEKKKILGRKAKTYIVNHDGYEAPKKFHYIKKIKNDYNTTFPEIPGLLAEYYVTTYDVIFKYELSRISEYEPDRDLFGIPSDFEQISIDDFMDRMIEFKSKDKK